MTYTAKTVSYFFSGTWEFVKWNRICFRICKYSRPNWKRSWANPLAHSALRDLTRSSPEVLCKLNSSVIPWIQPICMELALSFMSWWFSGVHVLILVCSLGPSMFLGGANAIDVWNGESLASAQHQWLQQLDRTKTSIISVLLHYTLVKSKSFQDVIQWLHSTATIQAELFESQLGVTPAFYFMHPQ